MGDRYEEPLENPFAKPAPAPARAKAAAKKPKADDAASSDAPVDDGAATTGARKPASRGKDVEKGAAKDESEKAEEEEVAEEEERPPATLPKAPMVTSEKRNLGGCCRMCVACCGTCHGSIVASATLSSAFLIVVATVAFALFVFSCVYLKGAVKEGTVGSTCGMGCQGGTCQVLLPGLTSCSDVCNSGAVGPYTPFSWDSNSISAYCTFPVYLSNIRICVTFFTAVICALAVASICRAKLRIGLAISFFLLLGSAVGFSYLMIADASAVDKGQKQCLSRFSNIGTVPSSVYLTCSQAFFAAVAVVDFFLIPLSLYAAIVACGRYRRLPLDAAAIREAQARLPAAEVRPDFDNPEGRPEPLEKPDFAKSTPADSSSGRPTFD